MVNVGRPSSWVELVPLLPYCNHGWNDDKRRFTIQGRVECRLEVEWRVVVSDQLVVGTYVLPVTPLVRRPRVLPTGRRSDGLGRTSGVGRTGSTGRRPTTA